MSNPTYANIFNILKPIEAMTERKSGYFSFSASGKDQNLNFRLLFSGNDRGTIKYEMLDKGERSSVEEMLVNGRPNCIIDKDVTAIAEQMAVLEVSKGVTDVIVAIVEGLRRMEVVAPVFALNRAIDSKNTQRAEYVFGIAAYLLDDQYQPCGRISLSITVFKMSQVERTANLIRKANAERDAEEGAIAGTAANSQDRSNDRYKITAMIQPGSPAMEQLIRSKDVYADGVKVSSNELPRTELHGMKDTSGNESVCIDPELLAELDAKTPKFNFAPEADNAAPGFAEYAEQTKRLHITPDPTAELGYKVTDMHGDRGVIVPVSQD